MSLENNVKRIADALEALVKAQGAIVTPSDNTSVVNATPAQTVAPAPAPVQPAAPVAPVQTAAPAAPVQPAAVAQPAATGAMTAEQLNAAFMVEFKRLGAREPIDAVLTQYGVSGVQQLTPEQHQPVLAAVRALQP